MSLRIFLVAILAISAVACRQDMHNQARYKSLAPSAYFEDGRSARPLVEGTIPRGHLREDTHLYTGKVNGNFAAAFPFPLSKELLQRGQERFNIFCAPCHDRLGNGQGMVVQRGFRRPPSFHIERLRNAPPGYYFDVITNGFATMSSYAEQIPVRDRWAIIAYVRTLQLSQHATIEQVPEPERKQLETNRGR